MVKLLRDQNGNLVEFEAEIKAETTLAIEVDFGGDKNAWIPRSQVEEMEKNSTGVLHTIYIPEWLAEEKWII